MFTESHPILAEAFAWVYFLILHVMELYVNRNPGVPIGLQAIWRLFQKLHVYNMLNFCKRRLLFHLKKI